MAVRIKYKITLTKSERSTLEAIIIKNSPKSDRVNRYHVSVRFVEKLRKRFVEEGFELALSGKQVGGYFVSKFDGRVEAHLVSLRCSAPPVGYNKWTLRLLVDKMVELSYVDSMSKDSVHTLLKKINSSLGKSNNG